MQLPERIGTGGHVSPTFGTSWARGGTDWTGGVARVGTIPVPIMHSNLQVYADCSYWYIYPVRSLLVEL